MRGHHFRKVSRPQETAKAGQQGWVGQEPQEMEVSCVSKDITSGSSAVVGCVPGILCWKLNPLIFVNGIRGGAFGGNQD